MSDNEIIATASLLYPEFTGIVTFSDSAGTLIEQKFDENSELREGFIEGAKWYRDTKNEPS